MTTATARPAGPPRDPAAPATPGAGSATDSFFEASAFESSLAGDGPPRWLGWRRRALMVAALLGCLALFALARGLADAPTLPGLWSATPGGDLLLRSSTAPALEAQRGRTLAGVAGAGLPLLPLDALLLHRWQRWQVDDALRVRQTAEHLALAQRLGRVGAAVELHFADGAVISVPLPARGYAGLGFAFWGLAGLSLGIYLLGVVLLLARPQAPSLLFVVMAMCQATNLMFMAVESVAGLGLPAAALAGGLPLRVALDLATAAAAVHAFALHPLRLPRAAAIAAGAWGLAAAWLLAALAWPAGPLWWSAQMACMGLGGIALAVAGRSHRLEPNPYALVMCRLATAALIGLLIVTAALGIASHTASAERDMAAGASLAWYLFMASLLLLTPFIARSRQVLREFALLAGVSTVATALDLLFVALFSLDNFTSLAVAVFIGLGLYAGARQWVLNRFIGNSMLSTERAFDHIYRAAREVQAHPRRYPQRLAHLLRDLFEPLEMKRVERVPVRARVLGGGSALLVPVRVAEGDPASAALPSMALVLRFAQRGQRLFTVDDARLADRVVDQLRRAVAYDRAVERGRFEERQRIAQDLHDDIGARLLTLMYQAQSPQMEDYIRHTLQDLKTLTRGLAAAEHPLSHAAAEWKSDIMQRLTAAHVGLGWSFNCDRDLRLTMVQWSALTRVLRELVSNALYHGHAARIDVAFQLDGRRLTLQVADDGIGRDPKSWSHGLGLGGVRKRVKVLGGEVAWRENAERGIVCEVRVPDFRGQP